LKEEALDRSVLEVALEEAVELSDYVMMMQ
jgi:hypothetical protein